MPNRDLDLILDHVERIRQGRLSALRGIRPRQLWNAGRAIIDLPRLECPVADDPQGARIRSSIGNGIRLAIELPPEFDVFINQRERANNLRKSMRRASADGIKCRVVQTQSERARLLHALISSRMSDPQRDHLSELDTAMGLGPAMGTHMVAVDNSGHPVAAAIMLKSSLTAHLAFLCSDTSRNSTTTARYLLNTFVVQQAIESGATVLLGGNYLRLSRNLRAFARNTGYRPRRVILVRSG